MIKLGDNVRLLSSGLRMRVTSIGSGTYACTWTEGSTVKTGTFADTEVADDTADGLIPTSAIEPGAEGQALVTVAGKPSWGDPVGGTPTDILVAKVTLNTSQIENARAVGVEVVPAPTDPTKTIWPLGLAYKSDITTPFVIGDAYGLELTYDGNRNTGGLLAHQISQFALQNARVGGGFYPPTQNYDWDTSWFDARGKNLTVQNCGGGEWTGGEGTLEIAVAYVLI